MKQMPIFKTEEKRETTESSIKRIYLGPKSHVVGYENYLKSKEWRDKRRYAIHLARHKCQQCGKSDVKLEVHHIHYNTLYHERVEDVLVLCNKCHKSADSDREHCSGLETWASKVYGDNWESLGIDYVEDRYNDWLERKEFEDDY